MSVYDKWFKRVAIVLFFILLIKLFDLFFLRPTVLSILSTVIPFIFSFVLAWLLNPAVTWLSNKLKFPRWIGTLIVYVIILVLVVFSFVLIIPEITKQFKDLFDKMTNFEFATAATFSKIDEFLNVNFDFSVIAKFNEELLKLIGQLFENSFSLINNSIGFISNVAFGFFIAIMVIIASIYMLIDFDKLTEQFYSLIPKRFLKDVHYFGKEVNDVLIGYIRGLLLEIIFITIVAYILFLIFGIEGALVFAVIVGITNIIPYLGPYIGAIPVLLFALTDSFSKTLVVIILIIVIQQIDGIIIKPKVFGKTTKVHPAVSIIAIILFGNLFGFLGIVIAIPLAGLIIVIIKFIYNKLVKKYPDILT